MHNSQDKDAFFKLIHPLTGDHATVTIGASFHPYQLMPARMTQSGGDESGGDIWSNVFEIIETNKYCDFGELIDKKYFFHMNPPGQEAFPIRKWDDKRLFHEINPEFSKFVPFVIPYLTHNHGGQPLWLMKLHEGMITKGNAHEFITEINQLSRFLMPEPSFIIGFEEFHSHNPGKMINHFVDFLEMNIKPHQ